MVSSSLVSMLLTYKGTIGQGNFGGRGRCTLRIHRQSIQTAVDGERTIMLDCRIQGNVAATGSLGGSITVAGQRTLLQGSNAFAWSLVSTNARCGANLYRSNTG